MMPFETGSVSRGMSDERTALRWFWFFAVLTLLVKLLLVFTLGIQSDEPQHLHVVWAWSRGLVQYRDVFDNHTPLFHMFFGTLFRPIAFLWGEHASILLVMRLVIAAFYVVVVFAGLHLGRRIYSSSDSWWAAVFTAVNPVFCVWSVQFRTDLMWTACWVLFLCQAFTGSGAALSFFLGGLLLGICFCVSMKSLLLGVTLIGTALILRVFFPREFRWGGWPFFRIVAAVGGFVAVPALLIVLFWANGALRELVYGVIEHNRLPGLSHEPFWTGRKLVFPLVVGGCVLWCRLVIQWFGAAERIRLTVWLTLISGFYLGALISFWPILTEQNFLPVLPVLSILVVWPVIGLRWITERWAGRRLGGLVLPLVAALCLAGAAGEADVRSGKVSRKLELIDAQLSLVRSDEFVMDSKGEAIFRMRPFYFALETLTMERLVRGLIPDEIPEALERTNTHVVWFERLPDRALRYVQQNYLPAFDVTAVSGVRATQSPDGVFRFRLAIPGRYSLLDDTGRNRLEGLLDGASFSRDGEMAAGEHEFRPTSPIPAGVLTVFWTRAADLGYSPREWESDLREMRHGLFRRQED